MLIGPPHSHGGRGGGPPHAHRGRGGGPPHAHGGRGGGPPHGHGGRGGGPPHAWGHSLSTLPGAMLYLPWGGACFIYPGGGGVWVLHVDVDLCGEYQEKHCVLLASGYGIGVGLQLHQLHHHCSTLSRLLKTDTNFSKF